MYCKVKKISWNSLYSLFVKCTLLQLSTILFVLCNLWGSTYHHTRQIEYSSFSVWLFFSHSILHRNTCDRRSSVFLPPPPLFFSIFFVPLVIHKHKHTSCFMF
ncbi:putative protein of unknown function, transcription is upregulated in clinical isolates from HIV patients with oral candidiasis [Candida albicans P75010]|nr:putative protein of unknown function, transcription is upregulated in clinical isolates from HIV patients with oral candidiasis [Candida albicans P75010]